ncbi:MAG: hypothetical protein HZY76_13935 [Anaerolineae bacterium]|nr:MAG: hypothetical protein HZY76_13935 [Anaerolineae bacterium]
MFPSSVFTERRQLSDMIAALPPAVLKDNAAALLNLLNEFQRSLALGCAWSVPWRSWTSATPRA